MTVLVTGGGGLLGRWVVRGLVESGEQVHVASRRGVGQRCDGVLSHAVDLLHQDDRRALLRQVRPQAVVHLAWDTAHGRFWHSPLNDAWQAATVDLVRVARDSGAGRVVVAGTCAEYDWSSLNADRGTCSETTTPLRPATPYGAAKLRTLERLSALPDAETWLAWGRVFSPFGPGEDARRLLPSIVIALLEGRPAAVSSPQLVRDYLHAEQVGRGFVALLRSQVAGPVNVASGVGISLGDLAGELARLVGRPDDLRLGAGPARVGEPARLVADVERLRREVGFDPADDLVARLRATVQWWRTSTGEIGG